MVVTPSQGKYYHPAVSGPPTYQGAYSRQGGPAFFQEKNPLANMIGMEPGEGDYGIDNQGEQHEDSEEHLADVIQARDLIKDNPF